MPKRLAITIAGAVSLGSYEAGVLYEIITALGQHNTHPETTADERIEIDVLTGASAGGMTAAIAAQKLLYDGGSMASSTNNPFYLPWVADISLDGLLQMQSGEDPSLSLFSSNLIEQLARKYLTSRYPASGGHPPQPKAHPAAAKEIRLGLALSNLNGVPYELPLSTNLSTQGAFGYTRYQDEMSGKRGLFAAANGDGRDTLADWEPWRAAAVSCGAFPFAFRVKALERHLSEYTRPHLLAWSPPEKTFAYTDGGVFQNEPLGLAKDLVDEKDQHRDTESRFYLFIAPAANSPTAATLDASQATFVNTAKALVGAVLHQAQFQDWIDALRVNEEINLFNVRALELHDALLSGAIPPEALQPAADKLLPGLFAIREPLDALETQAAAQARLREQFGRECQALDAARGPAATKAWIDSILVLETAANLNTKDEMIIYSVTAKAEEMAGHRLFSFQGFFDFKLREHDYRLGRFKARQFLQEHLAGAPPPKPGSLDRPDIGPIRFHPDPHDPAPDPRQDGLADLTVDKLDLATRQRLLDTLDKRLDTILVELGIPWIIRTPLKSFYLIPKLKKQLDL